MDKKTAFILTAIPVYFFTRYIFGYAVEKFDVWTNSNLSTDHWMLLEVIYILISVIAAWLGARRMELENK